MGEPDEDASGGAFGGGVPGGSAEEILRLHERYLEEVVEGLGLCPFARRCREQDRIRRPLFDLRELPAGEPSAVHCAREVATITRDVPEVEVILLTFVVPEGHSWQEPSGPGGFEDFVRELRAAYEALADGPRYYMVSFHPGLGRALLDRKLTQDSLVPLIRRTPDPVIQCIRAELLDSFRQQAQVVAEERFRAEIAKLDPELRILLEHAIQADPELSSEIARNNFKTIGEGEGREDFERRLAEIRVARQRLRGRK
ncbi:MAG TPA: DUF1415 family protein [Nannocystis exedens]|nr:DUF1415 family protein [Nannocystis exedens]